MADSWVFAESSTGLLKKLMDFVEQQPTPDNKWNAFFNKSPPKIETEKPKIDSVDVIVLSGDSNTDLESCRNEECITAQENVFQEDLTEVIQCLNSTDVSINKAFILSFCVKNINTETIWNDLALQLNEEQVYSFYEITAQARDLGEDFYQVLFKSFAIGVLKNSKQSLRLQMNAVIFCFRNMKRYFIKFFLTAWLNDEDVEAATFEHFVNEVNSDERLEILEALLSFETPINMSRHSKVIHNLYSKHEPSFSTHGQLIKLLMVHSGSCRNDLTFSKLLLHVIQRTNPTWGSFSNGLKELCDTNNTVLKTPCINALKKLNLDCTINS